VELGLGQACRRISGNSSTACAKRAELTDLQAAGRHPPTSATLVDQSDKALLFHNASVIRFRSSPHHPLARARRHLEDVKTYGEIELKLKQAIDHPIAPIMVNTSRVTRSDARRRRGRPLQAARSNVVDL